MSGIEAPPPSLPKGGDSSKKSTTEGKGKGKGKGKGVNKRHVAWMIPLFIVIQMIVFVITMYVNNCTSREDYKACVGDFLKRFAFQPLRENPIYGPSTSGYVVVIC